MTTKKELYAMIEELTGQVNHLTYRLSDLDYEKQHGKQPATNTTPVSRAIPVVAVVLDEDGSQVGVNLDVEAIKKHAMALAQTVISGLKF